MGEPRGLEYFFKNKVGRIEVLKDMDNTIHQSGDFRTLEEINVIVRSLYSIFLIAENTYLFDPELGIGLYKYVFEPVDITTKTSIEQEISNALSRYENRAYITHKVLFFRNQKGFRIEFMIDYKGLKKTVNIDIDESLLRTLSK